MARWNSVAEVGEATKLGEWPPFGPQVSVGIISMLGKNKDMFLRGRRAEIQGLGIGALAYYRRVVESQKDHIINEIIKLMRRTNSPETQIEKLKSAKKEKQFKKAVELISDSVPKALLINDYNPLALLDQAMTKGADVQTDSDALRLATAIRKILTELAERLVRALEDQADLDEAVNYILQHDG
jgi:coproporphyrinogen III oxidase-like Fe-S oxidoreductase